MNYDPLGDCSRSNRNRDYWEKQRTRGNEQNFMVEITKTPCTLINNAERLAEIRAWKIARMPRQFVERYIELDEKYTHNFLTPDEWREFQLLEVRR